MKLVIGGMLARPAQHKLTSRWRARPSSWLTNGGSVYQGATHATGPTKCASSTASPGGPPASPGPISRPLALLLSPGKIRVKAVHARRATGGRIARIAECRT